LKAGDVASFVLEEAREGEESPSNNGEYVSRSFKETVNYWRTWLGRSTYRGRWREMVNRSALTLKLLTSLPHGSIVAAPTFGLPENIGGGRNWDYRYTWVRDSTFTLYALMRLGFTQEAEAFLRWIEQRCDEMGDGGSLQVLYGTNGQKQIEETVLDHLEGYRGSKPVRIGNDAYRHHQLDIYGELMDAVYLYDKLGTQISYDLWCNLARLLDWLCDNWEQPGEGIWETRAGREEFLYSRVLCWVAFDRGLRLSHKRGLPAPIDRWQCERDRIYRDVMQNFWNADRRCFVQRKGALAVDAASLLLPLLKFIGPRDPRWIRTLQAIEEDLVEDSLVYRYRRDAYDDGLSGREGTFSACTFWFAECLARSGDLPKARLYFEKALGYANHVGLYAEELGPGGEHLGNFPQALTHLALISAAYDLDRRLSDSEA
jgi:GH15 family glucan-1,4-alpha-glucosidase